MKRLTDLVLSFFGLLVTAPILLIILFLVWLQDYKSPFYIAERVGKDGKLFKMYKLRSMIVGADQLGASSTSAEDCRITKIGFFVRKFKLDELFQLINVLLGDMSLVGPRPNVMKNGVELYTAEEMRLLSVRPGLTDIASIVFFDEGEILKGSKDPDGDYNRLIRPWKSRLGLLYIDRRSIWIDFYLTFLTICTLMSKKLVLQEVRKLLLGWSADTDIIEVCERKNPLKETRPPGALVV